MEKTWRMRKREGGVDTEKDGECHVIKACRMYPAFTIVSGSFNSFLFLFLSVHHVLRGADTIALKCHPHLRTCNLENTFGGYFSHARGHRKSRSLNSSNPNLLHI